ncbi:hypothetical protein F5146DRAFT_1227444 [Armillaria mellea]|nr:hypothetical protein F5146DRAFT_1227444 [Armillaria mellea]
MATRTDIPDLSDDDKALTFHTLDVYLNQTILFAFLQGIYTGIVAYTVSRIFSRRRDVGINAMALVIMVLCILTSIDFALYWLAAVYSFIHHGQNFWTAITTCDLPSDMTKLFRVGPGVVGCISTIITDFAMVWRCLIVWGRHWIIILLPLVFMAIGTAFKILQIRAAVQVPESAINIKTYTAIYISLILATTLLCTLLIVYCILTYGNIIEIIVESAALYSTTLIIYVVFLFQNGENAGYLNSIAEIIKGVAPTLLVGRVISGHSRPDDSWKGGAVSSLHFETSQHNQTSTEMSAEEDNLCSNDFVLDVEAQTLAGQPDEERVNVCQRVEPEPVANEGV